MGNTGRHLIRVLVTGRAGFIGFHVSRHLLARGDTVLGIDSLNDYYDVRLKHARLADLAKDDASPNGGFAFKQVDFSDHAALEAARRFEAIPLRWPPK